YLDGLLSLPINRLFSSAPFKIDNPETDEICTSLESYNLLPARLKYLLSHCGKSAGKDNIINIVSLRKHLSLV
ncbi:hypothetical protein Tco_1497863, partial [Tanacetum coccineum]